MSAELPENERAPESGPAPDSRPEGSAKGRGGLRLVHSAAPSRLTPYQRQLVLSVLRLIEKLVDELAPNATDDERAELIAEGQLAASVAALRYNRSYQTRFVTYVHPYICGAIVDRLRRESQHRALRRAASSAARQYLAEESDESPAAWEDREVVEGRLSDMAHRFLAAMIAGMSAAQPNPEQELMDIESYQAAVVAVHEALDGLEETEKKLYRMRYLEGLSQEEMAAVLGVDARTVRRYHDRFLEQLRRVLEAKGIREAPNLRR